MAVESCWNLIVKFPDTKAPIHAEFRIASCLEEMEKREDALNAYERLFERYGDKRAIQIRIDRVQKRLRQRNR